MSSNTQSFSKSREYPKRPFVGVGAVFLNDNKILMMKREHEPRGVWSIPGGLIELGETAAEAIIREMKEEIGVDIEVKSLVGVYDYKVRDKNNIIKYHYVIIDYLVNQKEGQNILEHETLKWIKIEDLDKYNVIKTHKKLVEDLGY